MIRNIIIALIGFSLIALLVIWILMGGPRKLVTSAKESIEANTPSVDDIGFRLPWQPIQIFPTLDITDALDLTLEDNATNPEEKLHELELEYERLRNEVGRSRTFGNASPYAGAVTLTDGDVRSEHEYLQISAGYANSAPIDLTGWRLESALSGTQVSLPPVAAPFIANGANALLPLTLPPGGLAIVASAASPIGVSFRENICTGYLGQFQQFNPPLQEMCPSPSDTIPLTAENLARFGDACFDAIQGLSACRFPNSLPTSISGSCRAYLTEFLSYNGCVNKQRTRSDFHDSVWRVYLESRSDLWRDSHDAIRLLDAQGRTVSVFVY